MDNSYSVYVIKGTLFYKTYNEIQTIDSRDIIEMCRCKDLYCAGFMDECNICDKRFMCASTRNEPTTHVMAS
jgi:hypothetical protein